MSARNFYEYSFGVQEKVALVTGGTRGIGFMIAEGLVRAGAKVYVASRKEDACALRNSIFRYTGSA